MKDNLKLLIDPVYTVRDVDKCASFWALRKFGEHWVEGGKNRVIYLTVGEEDYRPSSLPDERWIEVPVVRSRDKFTETWFPHDSLYKQLNCANGAFGDWDILLTTRNIGFYWRRLVGISGRGGTFKYMALREPFPFLGFKSTYSSGKKGGLVWRMDALQCIANYLMFDRIYIDTVFERAKILETARAILSPIEQRELRELVVSRFVGYDGSSLDHRYPLSKEAREVFLGDPMWIMYAQRIGDTQKRFSVVYELLRAAFAKLVAEGFNFRMQVCANNSQSLPLHIRNDSKFLVLERPPREKFWELLKRSHIVASFSKEEGLPTSIVEAVVLGAVCIVKREEWSVDMFGRDYPWFVDDVAGGYALLKRMYLDRSKEWERFTGWYGDFFLPKIIEERGVAQVDFEDRTQKWAQSLARDWKERAERSEAVKVLLGSSKKGVNVDLLEFAGTAREVKDLRKLDLWKNVVYSRRPARWILSFFMRAYHGWRITPTPWELIPPK